MDQIATAEPRPLRQIDDTIPTELERICQKALAKRASERYSTARDMADDLRHFLETDAASGLPAGRPEHGQPGRLYRPRRSTPLAAHLRTIRLRRASRQDHPQGAEIVRPARRRLLPRAAPRPPRPRRPAREPPVLEDPDRIDRPRHHLPGRPDLRPVGLRQVVAGQGGLAAPAGQARPAGLHRGDARGDRGPAAQRAAQGLSRLPAELEPRRCAGGAPAAGTSCGRAQKVLLVLDQFEQWLFARGTSRTPSWSPPCGNATASTSRRSSWSATTSGWRRPGS